MNATPHKSMLAEQVQGAAQQAISDCDVRWLVAMAVACGTLLKLVLGA